MIIISAKLKGIFVSSDIIEKKQSELIEQKKMSQPSRIKTCGSTFKNLSEQKKAWQIIKESGCHLLKEVTQLFQKNIVIFLLTTVMLNHLILKN